MNEKDEKFEPQISVFGCKKVVNRLFIAILISVGSIFTLIRLGLFEEPYLAHSKYDGGYLDTSQVLMEALETNLAGNWSKKYTSESHLMGTNYALADWTRGKFEEFGFKSYIETYEVLASYYKDHDLRLLDSATEDTLYQAPLKEDELEEDPGTQGPGLVPTFLAYAATGNVTADYIYVNYGTKEDFQKLKDIGVDVKGRIVIARYGRIFRGLKVKFAQDNGAAGVLLYSDPHEDVGITPANGYKQYPYGPARQESSVQRGSVQFLGGEGSAPGDPTTPGYSSEPGVERKDPHSNIGRIPVLPISYREVKPILSKLNLHGPKVNDSSWIGELDGFDYSIGPNKDVSLNLYNNQTFNITPIWNVIGEIEGENPSEVIVIGNHRDAWIKGGAGDPNSGSAVLLEVARALGALKKSGYKFKRSIILQSYDGEEYGLIGSTERGEKFGKEIKRKVIAYLNLDAAVTGTRFHMSSTPSLYQVLKQTVGGVTEYENSSILFNNQPKNSGRTQFGVLGSGSDYTVYLDHLGIPSVDFGFKPAGNDSIYQYHSNYDSYYWMSNFGDKGFVYHNVIAKFTSLLVFNLEYHKVIPLTLTDYSKELAKYYAEVVDSIPDEWLNKSVSSSLVLADYSSYDEADEDSVSSVSGGSYSQHKPMHFDNQRVPGRCMKARESSLSRESRHENLTLSHLLEKTKEDIEALRNSTFKFDSESLAMTDNYYNRNQMRWWQRISLDFRIRRHNKLIQYFERNFLHQEGLHHRPWFKHIVYASGRFTGYAGQTLPGLREAIEDQDFERFVHWLGIVSRAIRRASHTIDS